ncbi:MAG TPA: DivIVA domain-containing protein [Myxococcota bacterium]|jgi:cell division initiation protein|nr:DivIVA domain-containing protein [Myxococcota bacterium]
MRLTPLEIRQHKFGSAMRGFDRGEVVAFLDTVVADFEDVVRENAQLRREAERLARELDAYRGREKTIQDTLTTAQSLVEQLKRTAIKESESIVIDAELRAEKLLVEARERRAQLEGEIREQRALRQRLEGDLRRTLESYGKLVDAFAASELEDGE